MNRRLDPDHILDLLIEAMNNNEREERRQRNMAINRQQFISMNNFIAGSPEDFINRQRFVSLPPQNQRDKSIITEFTKLIKGEIDKVDIPNGCNRSGIKAMIETVINDTILNDINYDLSCLYTDCKDGVINNAVKNFLENIEKYATSNLGTQNVDIKMTKKQLLDTIFESMSDNKDYDVPHNEELKEQLPNINNLNQSRKNSNFSNFTEEEYKDDQGLDKQKKNNC